MPKLAPIEVPNKVSLGDETEDRKNHARISPVTHTHAILAIFPDFKYLPVRPHISKLQTKKKKVGIILDDLSV